MSIARVGGSDVFYEEKGSGNAVVLVPPAGGTASTWGDVAEQIAGEARVITYDRRGYLRSPSASVVKKVPPHANDLIGLIETLGVAPATLVGISVGATISLDVVVRRPDLVRSAVLYETPFHGRKHPDGATIGVLLRAQALSAFGRKRQAVDMFLRWAYTYATGGSAWDRFPEPWRAVALDHAPSVFADLGMATAEFIKSDALARVQTPVTCAHGAIGRRAMAKLMSLLAKQIPSARLVEIPGASHAVIFDRPKEFAQVALDAAQL